MPAKDGSITLEILNLKNVKITGESTFAKRQQSFYTTLRKLLRRKDIYLNRYLILTKVPYSENKNVPQKAFIVRKRSKHKVKTVEFCANVIGFMTRIDLTYKAVHP